MAEETRTKTVEQEKSVTYYKCDKCHGRFHEETTWEEDLNKVVFGAEAYIGYSMPANTRDAHSSSGFRSTDVEVDGEYEYLLCDRCHENAHEYLRDFF